MQPGVVLRLGGRTSPSFKIGFGQPQQVAAWTFPQPSADVPAKFKEEITGLGWFGRLFDLLAMNDPGPWRDRPSNPTARSIVNRSFGHVHNFFKGYSWGQ